MIAHKERYRHGVRVFAAALLTLSTSLLLPGASYAQDAKPNIVLILIDNLGYGELGIYGGGILRGRQRHALTDSRTKGCGSSTITSRLNAHRAVLRS